MKINLKVIAIIIMIILTFGYLYMSYEGILFFEEGFNDIDCVVFNVVGDAILVAITTYISSKAVSNYISKKEFNRNNKITINISEKGHSLYNFINFMEKYSDGNIYFGVSKEDMYVIEYVYKKYNMIDIVLNKAYNTDQYLENILNYPFIYSFLHKKNFIKSWKNMIESLCKGSSENNVELLKAILKEEEYEYFEKFSKIILKIKYYEIVNLNSNQSCILLITANGVVVNKISCIPNSKNGLFLYFDEDKDIEFYAFSHDYDGREKATNVLGFKYTNKYDENKPIHINLNDYIEVD